MESESNKTYYRPMPLSELLPGLSGINLSKDAMQTFTAKKKPRSTIALTRTSEKNYKPLTIAEMRAEIFALKKPSPMRSAQPVRSSKKHWNSSVKVDSKTKSHTAEGQMKNNRVVKVLNFQPKTKAVPKISMPANPETPKFTKPEFRAKKALHLQAKNMVRISGVCKMPETPNISNKPIVKRMTSFNKENYACSTNVIQKAPTTPIVTKENLRLVNPVLDTPLVNMSTSDSSFLEREKEVQDINVTIKALAEEPTLENIAEVSPPVSTPFKEYRNVQEFFNHSQDTENCTLYHDDTIMNFDKLSISKENSKREESVIVTLCDLLNKASVKNIEEPNTELSDLLKVKQQLEKDMKMIENGIKMLTNIKDSQMKSLEYVNKVINEKKVMNNGKNENNNILTKEQSPKVEYKTVTSPVSSKHNTAKKLRSPSYNIPKKNSCLRKKVLHKSMPNISEGMHTPNKDMDKRAYDMYMEMKNNAMNFLNTPCTKRQKSEVPDTPAVTSLNLQIQLNKIYEDNT